MGSYWEREYINQFDHIIVGAGLSGLFTALFYKRKYPQKRLIILDKAWISCGASTKNAGFACASSLTEMLDDLENAEEEDVFQLFTDRINGIRIIQDEFSGFGVYQQIPSFELISSEQGHFLDRMGYFNDKLEGIGHERPFSLASENISSFGFSNSKVEHLIQNNLEGGVHTAKLILALHKKLRALDVQFCFGCEVQQIEENAFCEAQTSLGVFQSETLTICTNAFTKKFIPELDVLPGRGQVLITEPIEKLPFNGVFHMDRGYYYFREIDGRVLMGGGRQLDIEGETTTDLGITDLIQNDLEQKLREIILPNTSFKVDQRWSGIMAFGKTKQPIVRKHSDRISMAIRYGGMGIALAPYATKNLVATL